MTARLLEEPVFFEAGGDTLFGVHTRPAGHRRGVAVVLAQGGDKVNAALSHNALATRMARELAEDGYDVLRFNYHGVGESTGVVETIDLNRPFTDDVVGASDLLRRRGIESFVHVGVCFGGRTALSSAPLVEGTSGVVMIAPPSSGYSRTDASGEMMARNRTLRQYVKTAFTREKLRGMFHARSRRAYRRLAMAKLRHLAKAARGGAKGEYGWVSPMLIDPLEAMVDARAPVLFVFGTEDVWGEEFAEARKGPLGRLVDSGGEQIEVVDDIPGVVNGLTTVGVQERVRELIVDWLRRRVPGRVRDTT